MGTTLQKGSVIVTGTSSGWLIVHLKGVVGLMIMTKVLRPVLIRRSTVSSTTDEDGERYWKQGHA